MPEIHNYIKYHPRWHRTPIPVFWWLRKWVYIKFISRELTSIAVASFAMVLLFQVRALIQGPQAYSEFTKLLSTPVSVILHSIALILLLFHSVTWFSLAPKALVVRIGKWRIPDRVIIGLNMFAWILISIVIGWLTVTM
ncbi:MAG: fumarate reductase subunit C [Candidatus Marinimicrobia bacterium]|nr:fumarate reductase subunit C [Candidatus Neomarinimicrobiota bacterium]